MLYNLDLTKFILLDQNHSNITNENLNTSVNVPEQRCNTNPISNNDSRAAAKPNGQQQLLKNAQSGVIFGESQQYKEHVSGG
jgi:hypothetical protein